MSDRSAAPPAGPYDDFLDLYPAIVQHANRAFRGLRYTEREECVAEAVAAAFQSFVTLRKRGKDPASFRSRLAEYAIKHVRGGRHVGGSQNSGDVLSPGVGERHGFEIHWTGEPADEWQNGVIDDDKTPVPDQVAFRIDFAAFLRGLSQRESHMAIALARGDAAKEVARDFGLTPGRVTQLRSAWRCRWFESHETKSIRQSSVRSHGS